MNFLHFKPRFINLFFLQFLFVSCSLFEQQTISSNPSVEASRICLSAEGRGRLLVSGHKFLFNFSSALERESSEWYMSLSFPLYGEETFLVSWDEKGLLNFDASFENKILKDKQRVDPEMLHLFLKKWAALIVEIDQLKKQKNVDKSFNSEFNWTSSRRSLIAVSNLSKNESIRLEFKNLIDSNYFGRYDIFMRSKGVEQVKLELIVRKCLEKAD